MPSVVHCCSLANIGDQTMVFDSGVPWDSVGDNFDSRFRVLLPGQKMAEAQMYGAGWVVDTRGTSAGETLSWKIQHDTVFDAIRISLVSDAARSATEPLDYKVVGSIKVLPGSDHLYVYIWVSNNGIVVGNFKGRLGRMTDGKSFRFFAFTVAGVVESDDPGSLIRHT